MDIRPGWGIGAFRFGLTESELVAALGPSDKSYTTDSGVRRHQYFGLRVEFAFEPENSDRFGWAEVHNPNATFFGRRVVGEPVAGAITAIVEVLGEEPEREETGWSESFFFARSWVELQVRFGHIVSVNFGVLYDDADEPQWPAP